MNEEPKPGKSSLENASVTENPLSLLDNHIPHSGYLRLCTGMPVSTHQGLAFCSINAEQAIATVENWKSEFQLS